MPGPKPSPGVGGDVPAAASDPREEVLVRFSDGHVITDESSQFFSVRALMYTLDNRPDGIYEGEYQLIVAPAEVFNRPQPPVPPFDLPQGPLEHMIANTYTKGRWTFGDGSSLTAIGSANFHAVKTTPGPDGPALLWITGHQIITGGTGRYEGAQGLKTQGGSANVGAFGFGSPSRLFVGRTVDTFRVFRGADVLPV
jgi:hypothetical protein